MQPVVLDLDRSVQRLPSEMRVDLAHLESELRYGCGAVALDRLQRALEDRMPRDCIAFLGSGDFHHLTLPLVRRHAAGGPLHVVVLDNHPDNMRYVFGVHCGSWVRQVARLPFVARVDVVGITSADVRGAHLLGNYLLPLWSGRLRYWCVGVDTSWSARLGVGEAVRSFATAHAMLDGFLHDIESSETPIYLSIDKDVLRPDVVHTNWDQGVLTDGDIMRIVGRLCGRIVGGDVTGEISRIRHASGWKRVLSALDGQADVDPAALSGWQARHGTLNARLLDAMGAF